MEQEYIPKRAINIHAHPDDQEFSIGGTLAKWAKAGCGIVSVVITSGDSGSNDPHQGADYKSELARLREIEQLAANKTLGITQTVFLHYPDGELEPTIQLRWDLTRLIRRYQPDAALIGNPEAWFSGDEYVNHPDHRAAAQAACEAVFPSAGTRLIFTDLLEAGYEPHNVKRLYVRGVEHPNTWVDITATIDIKIEALGKHASPVNLKEAGKWLREWAQEEAKGRVFEYAEAYRVIRLSEEESEK